MEIEKAFTVVLKCFRLVTISLEIEWDEYLTECIFYYIHVYYTIKFSKMILQKRNYCPLLFKVKEQKYYVPPLESHVCYH